MRSLVILLGLGMMGCPSSKADKFDEILGQLETFKTEMCACKDTACADKVLQARRDYRKTMRDKLEKGAKPSEAQDKRGKALEDELTACRKALVTDTGSAGSATPE